MKDIISYINENNDNINWANVKEVIEAFEEYEWGNYIELRDSDNEHYGTLDRLGSNKFFNKMMDVEKNGLAYVKFCYYKYDKKRIEKAYKNLDKNVSNKPDSFFYDEYNHIYFSPKVLSKYCNEIINCINF